VAVWFGLLILGAYLLASVPAAYLVARWSRGIDIRQYGSGNVGAANVLTVVSKRWAIPVVIFDIGKGVLAIWVAQLLGLAVVEQIAVGLATIIGHNWPVFLRFQGGRGIFTSLGVILILSPIVGLIILVIAYSFAPFRKLSLGVFIALVSLPILSWFLSQPPGSEGQLPITLGYLAILVIAIIKRLTAPRTSVTASVSLGQLLLNRLLLDRDIRDREAWIHRTPTQAGSPEKPSKQPEKQGKVSDK
jgi:glycerol-3-phosphate acyltransferase PlsY